MNVGKKALQVGVRGFHVLTLAFTASWLVATSQPRTPAPDCFVALDSPNLVVELGARDFQQLG
jgi:hypothetical protein